MDAPQGERPRPRHAAKRILLLALIAVCAVNVVTGGPLIALWVGSQVASTSDQPTLGAAGAVIVTLAAVDFGLVRIIGWLSLVYDRVVGRPPDRRKLPWHRSMRDVRGSSSEAQREVTAPEALMVLIAVAAVIAFEVWFFFFAGSSLPGGKVVG